MRSTNAIVDLLGRTAAGDQKAFEQLYQATSAKLFGVIIRILRRQDLAEEVLQEAYVKIWERASDYDPAVASPITWMAVIARNRALDEARRRTPLSLDDAPELANLPSDDVPALTAVENREDVERLLRCIDGLDEKRRDIVILAYRNGLSREALAQRFDCPVGTIKTWLRRSLAQLKDCLER